MSVLRRRFYLKKPKEVAPDLSPRVEEPVDQLRVTRAATSSVASGSPGLGTLNVDDWESHTAYTHGLFKVPKGREGKGRVGRGGDGAAACVRSCERGSMEGASWGDVHLRS